MKKHPAFVRMNPRADNMVTQPSDMDNSTILILCVECGWEGHAWGGMAPWPVFMGHKCRLLTESVSTSG
jgi:hypothetical protein